MAGTFNPIKFVEDEAAWHRYEPRMIVEIIHREAEPGTDFDQLCTDFEARITELSEMAKTHPDHAKLSRGIDTMRKVAQLLTPSGAEAELSDLANKIRVCVDKSDNYAATAGKHLRTARERCREIGLDFNKWCAQAELGIKRRRIYQLIGPDPIAAERRAANHNVEPENVRHCTLHSSRTWNNLPFPRRTLNSRQRGHQIKRPSKHLSPSPLSLSRRSPSRRISQSQPRRSSASATSHSTPRSLNSRAGMRACPPTSSIRSKRRWATSKRPHGSRSRRTQPEITN